MTNFKDSFVFVLIHFATMSFMAAGLLAILVVSFIPTIIVGVYTTLAFGDGVLNVTATLFTFVLNVAVVWYLTEVEIDGVREK